MNRLSSLFGTRCYCVGNNDPPPIFFTLLPAQNKGRNSHSTLYQSKLQSKSKLHHDRTTHPFIPVQVMCQVYNYLIISIYIKQRDVQQRTYHFH